MQTKIISLAIVHNPCLAPKTVCCSDQTPSDGKNVTTLLQNSLGCRTSMVIEHVSLGLCGMVAGWIGGVEPRHIKLITGSSIRRCSSCLVLFINLMEGSTLKNKIVIFEKGHKIPNP